VFHIFIWGLKLRLGDYVVKGLNFGAPVTA